MVDSFLQRIEGAWDRSDAIFDLLAPEALVDQPIPLRQPFVFYLGHLPAFAWNQLREAKALPPARAEFDRLFARGIDPVGVDNYVPSVSWPERDEVLAYRDRIRRDFRTAADDGRDPEATDRALGTILEHELMHQETLLYMVQKLPFERKRPPADRPAYVVRGAAGTGQAEVPAGKARMGVPPASVDFAWDNESPVHEQEVGRFVIDRTPVRHGEFLEFMEAGGFERRDLWSDADWAWRLRREVVSPPFWRLDGDTWRYRTLFDELPLTEVLDWPVFVSLATARAYARWRGGRLPTEAEFHRAAYGDPGGVPRPHPWGERPPGAEHGNFGFQHWSPTPVGSHPEGASAWGVRDLVGDGWEWTGSRFGPYPGFAPMPNYPGYSQDFFDESHYVMLGASFATDTRLVRRSFRNWFQPHYPYVFAKFRCVTPA